MVGSVFPQVIWSWSLLSCNNSNPSVEQLIALINLNFYVFFICLSPSFCLSPYLIFYLSLSRSTFIYCLSLSLTTIYVFTYKAQLHTAGGSVSPVIVKPGQNHLLSDGWIFAACQAKDVKHFA